MCYRVPLPQTLVCVSLELPACGDLRRARQHTALHACMCLVLTCTPENMRARASCWRARRRTCVHESCAGLHAGEHACTSLVLACTPENMRARVLCWLARRRTCVHEPCAGLHAGEHACTSLVLACTLVNMCARVSCWHTRQRTCVHVARAGIHAREHAWTWLVLTCTGIVYPLITVSSISMFSSRWTSAKRSRSCLIFVRTGTASSASS